MRRNTLVIGWFSFKSMGATAGDVIAKDIACAWLNKVGVTPRVAMVKPAGAKDVSTADVVPEEYDDVVFVCGPVGNGPPLNSFLDRFAHARKFALNVSLLQERQDWNPFEAIIERDSSERTNPDITLAAPDAVTPVVGLLLVGPQREYPTQRHDLAEQAFAQVIAQRDLAVVRIDTCLEENTGGLRNAAQIESVIGKMDAVLTTRLHGAVLALRRHVPAVAIDSVPGGTKLLRQMTRIGWPLVFHTGDLNVAKVGEALDYALTPAARRQAVVCAANARRDLDKVEREFLDAFHKAGVNTSEPLSSCRARFCPSHNT